MTSTTQNNQAASPRNAKPRGKRATTANAKRPEAISNDPKSGNAEDASASANAPTRTAGGTSKLDLLLTLLARPDGATLAELSEATGWQTHSVRGAMAGTLKRKGHAVISEKIDGIRRYRVGDNP